MEECTDEMREGGDAKLVSELWDGVGPSALSGLCKTHKGINTTIIYWF
jgi:hypothetical protein